MSTIIRINPPLDEVFCPTCKQCPCCCGVRKNHDPDCKFRRAVACPAAIECEHGRDVCPICDPCTCGVEERPGLGEKDVEDER